MGATSTRQWRPGYRELRMNVICYKELEVSMVQTWSGTCYSRQVAAPPLPRWRYRNRILVSARRVRGPVMESTTDRDQGLQDIWCNRLREELEGCKAPMLATLESSLDPNRAIAMLAGRTRITTLKRYVTAFQQWRLWLLEAKQIVPPGRPSVISLLGETNHVGRAYLN